MRFHDRLADREPKAEAFTPRFNLLERVEDFLEVFRLDADAGVD